MLQQLIPGENMSLTTTKRCRKIKQFRRNFDIYDPANSNHDSKFGIETAHARKDFVVTHLFKFACCFRRDKISKKAFRGQSFLQSFLPIYSCVTRNFSAQSAKIATTNYPHKRHVAKTHTHASLSHLFVTHFDAPILTV